MYRNFNITEKEKKQILESHMSHGYKKPLNEQSSSNVINLYDDVTEKKLVDGISIDGSPKKVGANQTIEFPAHIIGKNVKGKLQLHCDSKDNKFYFFSGTQIVASGYNSKASKLYCMKMFGNPLAEQEDEVNEQSTQYKVGQTLSAVRSVDKQSYKITVKQVGEGFILGHIVGPGKYEGQDLSKGFTAELNTNTPGVLAGNMEMGEFKIQ